MHEFDALKSQIAFLVETFALRDAQHQEQIRNLEVQNIILVKQVAWFQGLHSGGAPVYPAAAGSENVQ